MTTEPLTFQEQIDILVPLVDPVARDIQEVRENTSAILEHMKAQDEVKPDSPEETTLTVQKLQIMESVELPQAEEVTDSAQTETVEASVENPEQSSEDSLQAAETEVLNVETEEAPPTTEELILQELQTQNSHLELLLEKQETQNELIPEATIYIIMTLVIALAIKLFTEQVIKW